MALRDGTLALRAGPGVVVPQDLLAEDNVVAAVLFAAVLEDGAARAAGVVQQARSVGLSGGCFYRVSRGVLWETVVGIVDRGEVPEVPVVLGELERTGRLEEAGGTAAVHELAVTPSYVSGVAGWAARVVGKHHQRRLAALGTQLVQAAQQGADTVQVAGGLREALELVEDARQPGVEVALPLDQFLGLGLDPAESLLGSDGENLIPRGGLVVLAGKPGVGKTTLAVDLVFHLASGRDWLGLPVGRPLSVLVVENEGPVQQFQAKLAHKAERWGHPVEGGVHVHTWRWGSLDLTDPGALAAIRGYLDGESIDVIVADPLNTLGVQGVGSPEDTRAFVRALHPLGLATTTAFVFLHHFRKGGGEDELEALQGAWGGHLDTLLTLKPSRGNDEVRLSFDKVRWLTGDTGQRTPMILGLVRNTAGFEHLHDEGDPRQLEAEIAGLLKDGTWRTTEEIRTQLGVRKETAAAALKANPHLFRSEPGNRHGRHANATLWQLSDTGTAAVAELFPNQSGNEQQ